MPNTITIIGTVHYKSELFSADILYQKLCEIKPDVVLFEMPMDEANIMGWIEDYIQKYNGLEGIALKRYLESFETEVKPFDKQSRNDYYTKSYFAKEEAFDAAYANYFKTQEPNKIALSFKQMINKSKAAYGHWDKLTLNQMNSRECDIAVEAYHKIFRASMLAIFDLVPDLAKHKTAWLKRESYEKKVNIAMAQNILTYNRQYENKSIVVLCGYYHRFELINQLKGKQAKERFTLQ
jgi:hypothetical protein